MKILPAQNVNRFPINGIRNNDFLILFSPNSVYTGGILAVLLMAYERFPTNYRMVAHLF